MDTQGVCSWDEDCHPSSPHTGIWAVTPTQRFSMLALWHSSESPFKDDSTLPSRRWHPRCSPAGRQASWIWEPTARYILFHSVCRILKHRPPTFLSPDQWIKCSSGHCLGSALTAWTVVTNQLALTQGECVHYCPSGPSAIIKALQSLRWRQKCHSVDTPAREPGWGCKTALQKKTTWP